MGKIAIRQPHVEQAQFKRQRDLREALRPVRLDLAVFDLLRASDDLRQPLALDGRRDSVVVQLLHRNSYTLHAMQHKYILRFDGTDRDATASLRREQGAGGPPSWFDGEREFRQPFLIVAPLSSIAAFIPFRVS
jgi:hypothetical protein